VDKTVLLCILVQVIVPLMLIHISFFILFGILGYALVSLSGQLLGGAPYTSTYAAFVGGFALLPALITLCTNPIFAAMLYHGFAVSRFALPMMFAVGVCTSFFYSLVFLGATFTLTKLAGLVVICAGIALLAI
jgi:hypothetical protein